MLTELRGTVGKGQDTSRPTHVGMVAQTCCESLALLRWAHSLVVRAAGDWAPREQRAAGPQRSDFAQLRATRLRTFVGGVCVGRTLSTYSVVPCAYPRYGGIWLSVRVARCGRVCTRGRIKRLCLSMHDPLRSPQAPPRPGCAICPCYGGCGARMQERKTYARLQACVKGHSSMSTTDLGPACQWQRACGCPSTVPGFCCTRQRTRPVSVHPQPAPPGSGAPAG